MASTPNQPSLADAAMAFIAPFERPRFAIYNDNGKPAIGFGHNITPAEIKAKKVGGLTLVPDPKAEFGFKVEGEVSQKAVQQLFKQDVAESLAAAQNVLPGHASRNMTIGLASFLYNLGPNKVNAVNNPKLAAAVQSGNPSEIVDAFLLFGNRRDPDTGRLVLEEGLVKRREQEASLVATPDGMEGLMEQFPGADIGFTVGATGAAALQDQLAQDPSMARAAQGVRAQPVGMPGPSQNSLTTSDDFTPAAQGVIRAIQGDAAPARSVK